MTIWDLVMAEPKYLAIIGLGFDLIGGVLVALTAWFRVQMTVSPIPFESGLGQWASEPAPGLKSRRQAVMVGGFLLSAGFALQMYAAWLQIP